MECMVKDVNVYCEVHGEGTPILMIHGWGPDHRLMTGCMEPVFETLDTRWKRIYFDLPGMGNTEGKPWIKGSDQMLEVVLGFIDAIIPGERFVLAGQSYGGYLARAVLHKRREMIDGLLLICPAMAPGFQTDNGGSFAVLERDQGLIDSLSGEERGFFLAEGICAIQNKGVWERYRTDVLPGLQSIDQAFIDNSIAKNPLCSFDVDDTPEPYTKPTLMLAGRQDTLVGYRELVQLLDMYPRASIMVLDRAAHSLQMEQDVLFTAAVGEWLSRVSSEIG